MTRRQTNQISDIKRDSRPYILAGLAILVVMIGGVGTWASVVPLSGSLIASGVVTVETNRKTVQHLEGGIVLDLQVREGDTVQQNDVLIRLDDTRVRTQLAVIDGRLDVLLAREARLKAEQTGADRIAVPAKLRDRITDPQIAEVVRGQSELYAARRSAFEGSVSVFEQRARQLRDEIKGLRAQHDAKVRQVQIIGRELRDLTKLFEKGLVPRPRILALERERERLTGETGQHISEIARAEKGVGETKLEIEQLHHVRRETAVTELREVQAEIFDLYERRVVYEDQRKRIEIRAPQSGQVVGLSVHTTGAVISPGQELMDIVPREDRLVVEARLRPEDVDKVYRGSTANVRFSAFDLNTTPELTGKVTTVSGDRMTDSATQETYYAIRVVVTAEEISRLKGMTLRAGMPAEVFFQSGERTALNYLIKPFLDAMQRSLTDA